LRPSRPAVRYAEQITPEDTEGEQKYRIALQYFAKLAAGAGIKVDLEDIKALLESAVNSLKTELAVYAGTSAQEAALVEESEAEPKVGKKPIELSPQHNRPWRMK